MKNPKDLPVYKERSRILQELSEHQVIIVESPTGSGKTTQLPIILHEAGYSATGIIGVTQPRRIATLSVCEYIAKQFGCSVPGKVGYKMRFDDKTAKETEVKIMTDGILLQELKADNMLSRYSTMIVDEAHERSLNIDFILGLLKQVVQARPDFKLIISSATINPTIFSEYFDGAPVIHIDARIYPVKTLYEPVEIQRDYAKLLERIGTLLSKRQRASVKGDVLIFLSGEKLIKDCMQLLYSLPFSKELLIIPLYGRLPKEDQEKVFVETPEGKTKVVIATNIAETSITIDNITTVIDSGLAKMNFYNPNTFTSSLIEVPISKASCNQRKGRAGRTAPGYCYRLYSKEDFDSREMFTSEEIRRTDLSEVVLRMAELEIHNFESFDFITSPGIEGISSAVNTLRLLDAIDQYNRLTKIGLMMTLFPLLPRHSRMITEAIYTYPDVLKECIIAAAFLSSRSPFVLPPGQEIEARSKHSSFADPYGDFLSYLKLYNIYTKLESDKKRKEYCNRFFLDYQTVEEIVNIVRQLEEIISDEGIPIGSKGSIHNYLCAVSKGLIQFVCIRTGRGEYRSLTAEKIFIHPGSFMFKEAPYYMVAGEIVKTTRMFARSVSTLKKEWIKDIYPEFFGQIGKSPEPQRRAQKTHTGHEKIIEDKESSRIILYSDTYDIEPYKGKKKLIVVPYEKLGSLYEHYRKDPKSVKNYRVKITYRSFEMHTGDRLASIMKLVEYLDDSKGILESPPKGRFSVYEDPSGLADNLGLLFSFCKIKSSKRVIGFVTLDTDNKGGYLFKSVKSFHTAVDLSLYALQALSDDLASLEGVSQEVLKDVGERYRQISTIFENY